MGSVAGRRLFASDEGGESGGQPVRVQITQFHGAESNVARSATSTAGRAAP